MIQTRQDIRLVQTCTTKTPSMSKQRPIPRVLLCYLSAIFLVCLASIFGPTFFLVHHQEVYHAKDVRQIHAELGHHSSLQQQIIPLQHEDLVLKTIKSCWPQNNTKCKLFIPDPQPPDTEPHQRIGILTLPGGDLAQSLVNRVTRLSNEYNEESQGTRISIIRTSHIPPYGYGKNHGYTKIIRYTPEKMVMQVLDMLLIEEKRGATLKLSDATEAARLLLRWHCRLSHIAAHTAIASIPLVDFVESDTVDATLEEFITTGPPVEPEQKVQTGDDGLDDDDHPQDDDRFGMAESEWAHDSKIMRQLGGAEAVTKALDEIILEELKLSKNFTKWPCPSFWAMDSMGEIGRRLAKELSPDCDDPYAKCFVARDRCEFVGDAECKTPPAAT